jgi:hypothetical protein
MPNHLNQLQLARRWSMSPRTLERWRWTGVGPRFLKVGKRVVYPLTVVEAFEAERLHASTTERVDAAEAPTCGL